MPRIPQKTQEQIFLALLREVRTRQKVTQVGLAALLPDMGQPEISKVERGTRRLDVIELRTWLRALALPLPEFTAELEVRLSHAEKAERRLRKRAAAGEKEGA